MTYSLLMVYRLVVSLGSLIVITNNIVIYLSFASLRLAHC